MSLAFSKEYLCACSSFRVGLKRNFSSSENKMDRQLELRGTSTLDRLTGELDDKRTVEDILQPANRHRTSVTYSFLDGRDLTYAVKTNGTM
jgi:hypothetical protein